MKPMLLRVMLPVCLLLSWLAWGGPAQAARAPEEHSPGVYLPASNRVLADPLPAPWTEVISTGEAHTCRIKPDGSVDCFGDNYFREATDQPADLANPFTQISAGGGHTCALKSDGSVDCWGNNYYGQAADQPADLTNPYIQVSTGGVHTCGLKADRSIHCWGPTTEYNYGQVADQPADLTNPYIQVSAGRWHTCGLKLDGSIHCWGNTHYDQPATANPYTQVGGGWDITCALKTDGSVDCWGLDNQPADPTNPYTQIAVGGRHICALKADGSLHCWGSDSWGQSDDPATDALHTFTQVSAGITQTCGVKSDDSVQCWGENTYQQAPHLTMPASLPGGAPGASYSQSVAASGGTPPYSYSLSGSLPPGLNLAGDGTLSGTPTTAGRYTFAIYALDSMAGSHLSLLQRYTLAITTPPWAQVISAGGWHTCGLKPDGSVDCWGWNEYNQAVDQPADPANPYTQVSAGTYHTCALKADGSVDCWGYNDDHRADDQPADPANPYTQVSAGGTHTCALKADGSVDCWGYNGDHQADDQPADPAHPFTQVSAGASHTCALKADGSVDCWGTPPSSTDYGQAVDRAADPAHPSTQVSAGGFSTCALKSNGSVDCWGRAPKISFGSFTQVSAGGFHFCGLKPDGSLDCWGSNSYGQATAPAADPLHPFTQVSAGWLYTCGLKSDGTVECWGESVHSQAPRLAMPASLPGGALGVSYSQSAVSAGTPPYSYSLSGSLPPGLSLGSDGTLSGTPSAAGSYTFAIYAVDSRAGLPLSHRQSYTLAINTPPVLTAIGNKSIAEGSLLSFTPGASDPDAGQTLSYTLTGAPTGAAIDASSGLFTWTPTEVQGPGSYPITITVSDNGSPASIDWERILVTVSEVNQAPQAAGDGYTTVEDTPLHVAAPGVLGNDQDLDWPANLLSSSVLAGPAHGVLALQLDGSLVYTPSLNYHGPDSFTYLLSDGALTSTAQVTLTVTSVDDRPLVNAGADVNGTLEGSPVTFTGSYQEILRPAVGRPTAAGVTWSFGDGTHAVGTLAAGGLLTTTHVYADNGVFTVTLTVTSTNGLATSDQTRVNVENVAPSVSAGLANPTTPANTILAGQPLGLSGAFSDPGSADSHTLTWDFGDGQSGSGLAPNHTYTAPGDYTAVLTVSDDDGGRGQASVLVHVLPVTWTIYLPLMQK